MYYPEKEIFGSRVVSSSTLDARVTFVNVNRTNALHLWSTSQLHRKSVTTRKHQHKLTAALAIYSLGKRHFMNVKPQFVQCSPYLSFQSHSSTHCLVYAWEECGVRKWNHSCVETECANQTWSKRANTILNSEATHYYVFHNCCFRHLSKEAIGTSTRTLDTLGVGRLPQISSRF